MIDEARLYAAIGTELRKLREAKRGASGRLTQSELANLVGLERTSITNIESGNQKVPLHVLYRLCEELGVHVQQVLPEISDVKSQNSSSKGSEFEIFGVKHPLPPKAAGVISKLFPDVASR
jgi:transcriptional regulator with XRE-family HTH domain